MKAFVVIAVRQPSGQGVFTCSLAKHGADELQKTKTLAQRLHRVPALFGRTPRYKTLGKCFHDERVCFSLRLGSDGIQPQLRREDVKPCEV